MHIEDLFTPAQQALVAGLHQTRPAGASSRVHGPVASQGRQPPSGPLPLSDRDPPTGPDLGRIRHIARLFYSAPSRCGPTHRGRVFSLDRVPEKTAAARANLRQAGLDYLVECYTGEGDAFIATLPERVDFVFVDFGLPAFAPMFAMLESRLVAGAFLFVDGWSKVEQWDQNPAWAAFRSRLDETADWLTYILPLEKSHLIAVKLA